MLEGPLLALGSKEGTLSIGRRESVLQKSKVETILGFSKQLASLVSGSPETGASG